MPSINNMSTDEFHDWLIFESPESYVHYKAIRSLRYVHMSAVLNYLNGMREVYRLQELESSKLV